MTNSTQQGGHITIINIENSHDAKYFCELIYFLIKKFK